MGDVKRHDEGPDCPQLVLPHIHAALLARHNALVEAVKSLNIALDICGVEANEPAISLYHMRRDEVDILIQGDNMNGKE